MAIPHEFPGNRWRLPRQFANWLAMTYFYCNSAKNLNLNFFLQKLNESLMAIVLTYTLNFFMIKKTDFFFRRDGLWV